MPRESMARWQCRRLWVLCSGMGVAMLVMAAGLHLKQLASLSSSIAITGTVAYMVFFALGAGPVPGLLVPEITPARLRGERSCYLLCTAAIHWCARTAPGERTELLWPCLHTCATQRL